MSAQAIPPVFIVPNFHPASSGWLTNWSVERNHCANTYLRHLDRISEDPAYRFVLSEVNNLIAILNFRPERFKELKRRVSEGRVELVNGFFIEATMSLAGGELYARMGVEGMRWQQALLGVRPRFAWCIDICGTPDQLAQITEQLGLEALVFTRNNRRASTDNVFVGVSPDGSRTLVVAPQHYSDFGTKGICELFGAAETLTDVQLGNLLECFTERASATPAGAPIVVLGGKGDYSGPPANPAQPAEFLHQWARCQPSIPVKFSTFGEYVDALAPYRNAFIAQPVSTPYYWYAFWVENPRVKSWFRRCEHALHAAEAVATLANLTAPADAPYPAQDLYHAWLQLFLNADRNTLWGAAGGMVFEHPESWDAKDRFEWVERCAQQVAQAALPRLSVSRPDPPQLHAFNPLNWERNDPVDGLWQTSIPAYGSAPVPEPATPRALTVVPREIETDHYSARLDPHTGDIVSLRTKPSGRELAGGRLNHLVSERALRPEWYAAGDNILTRDQRPLIAASSEFPAEVCACETGVALTLVIRSRFDGGGEAVRTVRFNKHYPRIDFETELNDLPDERVVLAEFPLADAPTDVRRGVPFGFSHAAWPEPRRGVDGVAHGILPAVRWSDYTLPGGAGLALLDRGVTGREMTGGVPALLLLNTVEKYYGYPNAWLSGRGRHPFSYALAVRDDTWERSRIARMAWEFNQPPLPSPGEAVTAGVLSTSDNLIVEAIRREGLEVEIRLVECLGIAGNGEIELRVPHEAAALTDFHGERRRTLPVASRYRIELRPQQIVTLRLRAGPPVSKVVPLTDWTPLVPERKRTALHTYLPEAVGHPPRGD